MRFETAPQQRPIVHRHIALGLKQPDSLVRKNLACTFHTDQGAWKVA